MANVRTEKLMTAEEFELVPDPGAGHHELVRGRLVFVSASSSRPAIIAKKAGTRVDTYADLYGLGIVGGADWGFVLGRNPDTVRAPDMAFVAADRVPADGIAPGFWPGGPELAVEVLSTSNRSREVLQMVEEYRANGSHTYGDVGSCGRAASSAMRVSRAHRARASASAPVSACRRGWAWMLPPS